MVQQSDNIIFRIIHELRIILLTIVQLLLFPCVLLLGFGPIYLCRVLVSFLSKWLRPDLNKLVVTRSSIMAVDDWNQSPKCNLVLSFGFEGSLDMDSFLKEIDLKVIRRKGENGELVHPEMQQYFESWLGFIFWKWEEDFQISKHMFYYNESSNDQSYSTTDVTKIENTMIYKPFPPKASPWEVLVIPNYKPDFDKTPGIRKSILIFRYLYMYIYLLYFFFEIYLQLDADLIGITVHNLNSKVTSWNRRWLQFAQSPSQRNLSTP